MRRGQAALKESIGPAGGRGSWGTAGGWDSVEGTHWRRKSVGSVWVHSNRWEEGSRQGQRHTAGSRRGRGKGRAGSHQRWASSCPPSSSSTTARDRQGRGCSGPAAPTAGGEGPKADSHPALPFVDGQPKLMILFSLFLSFFRFLSLYRFNYKMSKKASLRRDIKLWDHFHEIKTDFILCFLFFFSRVGRLLRA